MTPERMQLEPDPDHVDETRPKAGEVRRLRVQGVTYVQKTVMCGKADCHSCPHGPYWYQAFMLNEKRCHRYIGKDLLGHMALRWAIEMVHLANDPELPGMPDLKRIPEDARPSWLPLRMFRLLQHVVECGPKVKSQVEALYAARAGEPLVKRGRKATEQHL